MDVDEKQSGTVRALVFLSLGYLLKIYIQVWM